MKTLKVLIVEDDAMIGLLLSEVLEGMGHSVCAIEATEAGAVAAANRHRPDLMIVDVWLGDGNGVAAVEEIRRTQFIPHIIVSADLSKVRNLRPDAVVLQKPFRAFDLERAMLRALEADPDSVPPLLERRAADAKPDSRPKLAPRERI
jgi:DNA-binding response OmpR family regulator